MNVLLYFFGQFIASLLNKTAMEDRQNIWESFYVYLQLNIIIIDFPPIGAWESQPVLYRYSSNLAVCSEAALHNFKKSYFFMENNTLKEYANWT